MATSTGMISDTPPPEMKLGPKTPPQSAHAPTATTLFGVGIASYTFFKDHPHVVGDGTGDEQDIGFPRGRREEEPQAVDIVVGFVELFDFAQAGAASPRINYPDMQGLSKNVSR